jgi:recombination protein RecT
VAIQQLIPLAERGKHLHYLFEQNKKTLIESAPRMAGGDPQRLIRIAYNSIANDEKLLQCTHASILGGIMEALKLGLTLGGPMQEAWLIPFKDNRDGGNLKATFIVGYQGFRNIIDRAKSVIDLHPRAVYANDEFDFAFGSRPYVTHRPYWRVGGQTVPGPLIAVYAVAHLRSGGLQLEVMPKSEVDAHRARSRAKDSGPWVTDYDAMALKTVIRKIAKYVPKSSDLLARALDLDERADRGEDQEFELPPDAQVTDGSIEIKSVGGNRLDELKRSLQEKGSAPPTEQAPTLTAADIFKSDREPGADD